MSQTLRPYQQAALADALSFYAAAKTAPYGVARRQLYSSATATGKGSIILALQAELQALGARVLVLTPRVEILRGFAERQDPAAAAWGLAALVRWCRARGIWTYGRLYSTAIRDRAPAADVLIIDEAHHWMDAGGKMSSLLQAIYPAAILFGYSACAYRGSPQSTAAFLEFWGGEDKIAEILSLSAAAKAGWISIPDFRVVGLCDDEECTIQGGEFQVSSASALVLSRAEALANMIAEYRAIDDRPSMLVLPSSEVVGQLQFYLERAGVKSATVLQSTRPADRISAFDACRARTHVLISIAVVGEGVDLPWLRVLFDASPTCSPVVFVQRLGRITRPGDQPRYICVTRNLERHSHLLGDAAPSSLPRLSQQAFGSVGERASTSRLGLERLGRLKRFTLPGGARGDASGYSLCYTRPDGALVQFALGQLPWRSDVVCSTRIDRGKWQRIPITAIPADQPLRSMKGRKSTDLTPGQVGLWQKCAGRLGLDPAAAGRGEVDARALDVLCGLLLMGRG